MLDYLVTQPNQIDFYSPVSDAGFWRWDPPRDDYRNQQRDSCRLHLPPGSGMTAGFLGIFQHVILGENVFFLLLFFVEIVFLSVSAKFEAVLSSDVVDWADLEGG